MVLKIISTRLQRNSTAWSVLRALNPRSPTYTSAVQRQRVFGRGVERHTILQLQRYTLYALYEWRAAIHTFPSSPRQPQLDIINLIYTFTIFWRWRVAVDRLHQRHCWMYNQWFNIIVATALPIMKKALLLFQISTQHVAITYQKTDWGKHARKDYIIITSKWFNNAKLYLDSHCHWILPRLSLSPQLRMTPLIHLRQKSF